MRGHTAACSKYQEYIEEGVRTTAQSQPAIIRWKRGELKKKKKTWSIASWVFWGKSKGTVLKPLCIRWIHFILHFDTSINWKPHDQVDIVPFVSNDTTQDVIIQLYKVWSNKKQRYGILLLEVIVLARMCAARPGQCPSYYLSSVIF